MEKEIEISQLSDVFTRGEKMCIGFGNDIQCEEGYYKTAINLFNIATKLILEQSLFSPNEDFTEIKTENLK